MSHAASLVLADQIERLLSGDAWHGLNLEQLLADLEPGQAARHPGASLHSIEELVEHLDVLHAELLVVVGGRAYRLLSEVEQWPASSSRRDWPALCGSMFANGRQLRAAVARLSEAQMARRIENRDYTLEQLIHGFNQHTAYHLGQIALVKKMLLQVS